MSAVIREILVFERYSVEGWISSTLVMNSSPDNRISVPLLTLRGLHLWRNVSLGEQEALRCIKRRRNGNHGHFHLCSEVVPLCRSSRNDKTLCAWKKHIQHRERGRLAWNWSPRSVVTRSGQPKRRKASTTACFQRETFWQRDALSTTVN